MRVSIAAVGGATIAILLAALGGASHPAQFVFTTAAGCAFLALLTRPTKPSPTDWFTVRALLAVNLIVFGISYAHKLTVPVAAIPVFIGLSLLALTIRTRVIDRASHRRNPSKRS
jgi:hypothetical protein